MRGHRDVTAGMNGHEIIAAAYASMSPEVVAAFIDHCGIYQWAEHPVQRRQRQLAEQAAAAALLLVCFDADSSDSDDD